MVWKLKNLVAYPVRAVRLKLFPSFCSWILSNWHTVFQFLPVASWKFGSTLLEVWSPRLKKSLPVVPLKWTPLSIGINCFRVVPWNEIASWGARDTSGAFELLHIHLPFYYLVGSHKKALVPLFCIILWWHACGKKYFLDYWWYLVAKTICKVSGLVEWHSRFEKWCYVEHYWNNRVAKSL